MVLPATTNHIRRNLHIMQKSHFTIVAFEINTFLGNIQSLTTGKVKT